MKLFAAAALALSIFAAPAFGEEPDGLKLPPGFQATVVADGLMGMRHLAVRKNGDVYVSTRAPRGQPSQGVLGLRMTKDGKLGIKTPFSRVEGGTGIRIYGDALYATTQTSVYRWTFSGNDIVPVPAAQPLISGIPEGGQVNRMLTFDDGGALYLSVSGSGNICTDPNGPKDAKPVGLRPCPALANRGGVWRFSATKLGQKFPDDGVQIATGIRDMDALDWRRGDGLYGVMHGRNGTSATWPDIITAADDDAVAEEMHRIKKGANLGWPYTYYDGVRNLRLVSPEYGGDGKTSPTETTYSTPALAFPGHSAPLDMVFYNGSQFPREYRGGAFVAFHGGGGNGGDAGRPGFNVVYVPFVKGKPGEFTVFADGFAGPDNASKNTAKAAYRPVGLAVAPDGSLYIADDKKGRLWRITYGEPKAAKKPAPPLRPFSASRP
jgi:glucose/arabinose dehydrogenase